MKLSVNTVVRDAQGRHLLQMRDANPGICHPLQWNFFGGGLREGEAPLDGARRELREEIGVDLHAGEITLLGHLEDAQQRVHLALCHRTIERREVVLGEGAGFGYFALADIARIDATEMTRSLVARFLAAEAASRGGAVG
jgi:ADP-ribose pyrophosphatase YjhB (NUDIX family)